MSFGRTCLAGAVASVVALPVLPVTALAHGPALAINRDLGEQVAWPQEVALVARVYASLPAAQRSQTALLAGNYGEAGAIDRYGAQFRLPEAYSGHNNFWLWGPPPAGDTTVVAIGVDLAVLRSGSSARSGSPRSGITASGCPMRSRAPRYTWQRACGSPGQRPGQRSGTTRERRAE